MRAELPPEQSLAVPVVTNKSLSFREKADVHLGYWIFYIVLSPGGQAERDEEG